MGSSPKKQDAPLPPARKPERAEVVDPADIQLGGSEEETDTDPRKRGKRSLTRPTGSTGVSV